MHDHGSSLSEHTGNLRRKTVFALIVCIIVILAVLLTGMLEDPSLYKANFKAKNLAPSRQHIFGTDYMGRDMFFRTMKGLSSSILIGIFASVISSLLSITVGLIASCGSKRADQICLWIIDLFMGVPALVMLMLISYSVGGGIKGVVLGVAITHWPDLARVIRAEVLSVRNSQYVLAASKLGQTRFQIAVRHIVPYVFPQFLTGLILMFPHAILHEAGITFLGFGLPLESPAIGAILSESMQQIATGQWWLVLFPGICLLTIVIMIDSIGDNIRMMLNPYSVQD